MTPVGHVAITALAGSNPIACTVWGLVSHWLLDIRMPEYRPKGLSLTSPKTWPKYILWMLWQLFGCLALVGVTRSWLPLLMGMLPDIIEGIYVWAMLLIWKVDVWSTGENLFWFHRPNRENLPDWSLTKTLLIEVTWFVAAMLIILG